VSGTEPLVPRTATVDGEDPSIQDVVEAELRDRILQGDIEPGGRINVRQLERHFGVSHIPIREAIRRLEAEGLVVNVPRRGAVAAGVSLAELDDVYDLRRIIEPAVVRRAVARMTESDELAVLETFAALEAAEAQAPSSADFTQAHWDFHWSVLRPGSTGQIEQVLQKLWRVADRYVQLTRGVVIDVAHEQHHQLLEACLARRADEAEAILERHLHLTGDAIRRRLHQLGLE